MKDLWKHNNFVGVELDVKETQIITKILGEFSKDDLKKSKFSEEDLIFTYNLYIKLST